MTDLNEILLDRSKSYGSYDEKTAFVQHMKDEMRRQPSWATMHDGGREALDMIATKIGRLLHGDPNHEDSWVDIAGYADLAAHGDIQDREAPKHYATINVEEYWETECLHTNTWDDHPHRTVCSDCGLVLSED